MRKIILISSMALLAACSAPSVDDLVDDPKLLAKIVERCEKRMDQGKDMDTAECQNAIAASKRLMIKNAGDALKAAQRNARIVLKDAQRKSPELLDDLQKSAKEAMKDAQSNADELFEKAKKLLED